nr:hypothetical protein HMPREF0276_1121 [Corynebacterium accolens ATCC 49725]
MADVTTRADFPHGQGGKTKRVRTFKGSYPFSLLSCLRTLI